MKKFLGLCLVALVIYTMYYDLKVGTLPQQSSEAATTSAQQTQQQEAVMPSKKVEVKPGATVLSIVEHLNRKQSIPIQKIVRDFEQLNPSADANNIRIGKTYKFPVYRNTKV